MSEMFFKLWQSGTIQLAIWETVYMTLISTAVSYGIGLPLGLVLSVTDDGGIRPIKWLNRTLGVIVNALRKFESAGVIESRSSGMKGTYIKVLNDVVFDELAEIKKQKK